eukprot:scaffold1564_cov389-Prasinococcus_capsulatus_cf.AAC.9
MSVAGWGTIAQLTLSRTGVRVLSLCAPVWNASSPEPQTGTCCPSLRTITLSANVEGARECSGNQP